MEQYFNAGYFLMLPKEIDFGSDIGKTVKTCSGCINISVFDHWCLSWTSDELLESEKNTLGLTAEKLQEIQRWTDNKFDGNELSCGNAFPDLKTALEFKNLFFKNLNDLEIRTIYFPKTLAYELINDFQNDGMNNGHFTLRHNLIKKNEENKEAEEKFLGYDLIGVEGDGSFHSFYCHDITEELIRKFSLNLNENGLITDIKDTNKILSYLNDEETGLEPVPWYVVKTKQIADSCI